MTILIVAVAIAALALIIIKIDGALYIRERIESNLDADGDS